MTLQIIIGMLLRHGITSMGGGTVWAGLLTGDFITQASGVIAIVIGLGLSAFEKKKR